MPSYFHTGQDCSGNTVGLYTENPTWVSTDIAYSDSALSSFFNGEFNSLFYLMLSPSFSLFLLQSTVRAQLYSFFLIALL